MANTVAAATPNRTTDAASSPTLATGPSPVTPSTRAEPTLATGQRLGDRYIVRGLLGMGGMGAVYRAFDEKLEEDVALKIVRGPVAGSTQLRDEVRLAQKVTHENVCRTYDLEDVEGLHLVKMEYVDGETLAVRLAREPRGMPIREALRIARAVAAGLAAAHAKRIVHRDLKPGNVMITPTDRVVLMDFGLAQPTSTDVDTAGTPGYMAPEQIAGAAVDERADLYALGCLTYEMLAGERVFPGTTVSSLDVQHASTPPPDVRARRPDVPRWLARAVTLLLAKEPAQRLGGCQLLVAGASRRRIVLPIAGVGLVGAAVLVMWGARPPHPAHAEWTPTIADLPAYEELSASPSISPDGTLVAYASTREEPGVYRTYTTPLGGGESRLVAVAGGNPRWTRDGKALLVTMGSDASSSITRQPLDGSAPQDLGPGYLADDCGDAIVILEPGSVSGYRITLREADGHRRVLVTGGPTDQFSGPRCDRTGRSIVFTRGSTHPVLASSDIYVTDRSGATRQLTHDHRAANATFSPDGSIVFSARGADDKIRLYEMRATGGRALELTRGDGPDVSPDVSLDGRYVVFNRTIRSRMAFEATRTGVRKINAQRASLSAVRPIPGSDQLLAELEVSGGGRLAVMDARTGVLRPLVDGVLPFVSRDGSRVFFRTLDRPRTLQVVPIAGGAASDVATFPGEIVGGVDGPDGEHVEVGMTPSQAWRVTLDGRVEAEGTIGMVNPAPAGGWRVLQIRDADQVRLHLIPPGASLSHRGRELVAISHVNTWLDERRFSYATDTALHVIDVTTGAELTSVALPRDATSAVMTADGEHWLFTQTVAHVTRHVLTNFADRPR